MNRNDKILAKIDIRGKGLEIGPSFAPVAPRRGGYDVEILDCLSKDQLVAKYKNANVDVGNIEEVDHVWTGQSYSDLVGKKDYFDWIIASHVIEHTTDMIAFLNDCAELLTDDGKLSLVIPDKRFCFDYFRPPTGLARIVDAHVWKRAPIHSPGTVAEAILYAVIKDGNIAWGQNDKGGIVKFFHPPETAVKMLNTVLTEGKYFDEHAWCFTPHSFRLIIEDLYFLALSRLREECFFPTDGVEFFVTLSRHAIGTGYSRMQLLEYARCELASELISGSAC
jgi:SAM-dependent methyltransferase